MRWHEILKELDDYRDERADRDYRRELSPHFTSRPDRRPTFTRWPPSQQELREAERAILQDPQWLAYYSYFGWSSFSKIRDAQWRWDRDRTAFRFDNVPAIWYTPKRVQGQKHPEGGQSAPDRISLYATLNGKVVRQKTDYGHLAIPLPTALHQIKTFMAAKVEVLRPNLPYLHGDYYIRFGRWREDERSRNGLTGEYEAGVSAYHAYFDVHDGRWAIDPTVDEAAINGTLQSFIYERDKRIFLVTGRELTELGSDGEPLLKDVRMVRQLNFGDVYVPNVFDPREDLEDE